MPELRWILIVAGLVILVAVYLWGRRIGARSEEKETIVRTRAEPLISTPAYESPAPDPYANEPYAFDPDLSLDATQPVSHAVTAPARAALESLHGDSARREPIVAIDPIEIDADDEPTLSSLPQSEPQAASQVAEEAVTATRQAPFASEAPSSSPTPAASQGAARRPRTPSPRKILVLRLAAGPARIAGDTLRAAFAAQGLTFGKYEIFHCLHANGEVLFSVASMVEPGSFDLARMDATPYPGVTLFAQLPSSIPSLEVLEELLRHAKLLQSAVGGTLQDERGALLNTPRIQRLRQEVSDFDHLCNAQVSEAAETR